MTRLLEFDQIELFHDDCRPCDVPYRRVLEPLGYDYTIDPSHCDEARCTLIVKEREGR